MPTLPRPPYLLVAFDVDSSDQNGPAIIADVLAGFPADVTPNPFVVDDVYTIEVPPSQALKRFFEVGTYLSLKDNEHDKALRWVLQLCRIDEIATG